MVAAAVAVAVLGLGAALFVGNGGGGAVEPAPAFSLSDLRIEGATVALADFRGKPTVVNFFASWCAPCKRELPLLRDAAQRHDDIAFVGIAHQDNRELALAMLQRADISYPAGFDPDGEVSRSYRLRGLPATAFIAADGRLVGVAAGELDRKTLDSWLRRLSA